MPSPTHPIPSRPSAGPANWLGCYNTDVALWRSYGEKQSALSPAGGVCVTINRHGVVGNGLRIMAQFPNRILAARTLRQAGFVVTRALGCGHVKTNLSARYARAALAQATPEARA